MTLQITNGSPNKRPTGLNLRWLVAISLALLFTLAAAEGTPAGTRISNTARAEFLRENKPETLDSETVETVVSGVCNLSILPNGTVAAPAYSYTLERTGTTYFPYVLTNTGNDAFSFDLDALVDSASTLTPDALAIIRDQNANQDFDTGEPDVSELSLDADESAALLLAVTIDKVERAGDIYVNIAGICDDGAAGAQVQDNDNVSHLSVPLVSFSPPVKDADPEPGSVLFPGAALSYSITFTANDNLVDVVVSDVLDDKLTPPTEITDGLVEDEETGLSATVAASYDEATRTVMWRFDSLPGGMNVTLNMTTSVRAELENLPPETVVDNIATVESGTVPPTSTNTVVHDLRPIVVDIEKSASPAQVAIGDTLTYTLTVTNPPVSVVLETLEVIDTLPEALEYKPGTTQVTFPDERIEAIEPSIDGQELVWNFTDVNPGETLTISFETTVLPAALYADELINSAQALAQDAAGQAVADAAASVATVVELGVFDQRALLLGTAFIDHNDNGLYDTRLDTPVAGLRLYLNDGSSTVTDEFGRYTFQNLDPALSALRVDMSTAPSRFFRETPSEDKEGLWRVRLENGVVTRQDIPFLAPQVRLEVEQFLTVLMGPLKLEKRVFVLEDGLEVELLLESSEALKNLTLSERLPAGATLITPPAFEDGSELSAEGLELLLGDIPAGFTQIIRYQVAFEGSPETLLSAPDLRWDVR